MGLHSYGHNHSHNHNHNHSNSKNQGHKHNHNHGHSNGANKKILLISFIIIAAYMIVETIGGFVTNSLALLSDAGHMLSDAISLAIALLAFKFGERVSNYSKTYGYKRFEVLAAVLNGATLMLIAVFIFIEAIARLANPPEIATVGMIIISFIGLIVNIFVAWIMMRNADTKENLNMRGAFLHVLSDLLGSVGAIIAGLLIMIFGWGWADPLASVIVAALVLRSGFYVTKASLHVLMEGTPSNVDVKEVIQSIKQTSGVYDLHDLHIWAITSGINALSCHVVVDEQMTMKEGTTILKEIEHTLEHLNIMHTTIQLESIAHQHKEDMFCQLKHV